MGIVNIVIGLGISVAILLWIYRYGKQRIEREVITIENVRCPEQTQRTERSIKKGVGKSEHKGSHAKSSGLQNKPAEFPKSDKQTNKPTCSSIPNVEQID